MRTALEISREEGDRRVYKTAPLFLLRAILHTALSMSTAIPHLPREGDSTPDTPITEKKDRFASSPARDDDSLEDASSAGDTLIEEKSKGVVEMEYLAARINTKYLVLLYGGFMVLAYTLALSTSSPASLCPIV